MNISQPYSEDGYCFRWHHDDHTQLELQWVVQRERWVQRANIDRSGWGPAQVMRHLAVPADEDDARRIAEQHATGVGRA